MRRPTPGSWHRSRCDLTGQTSVAPVIRGALKVTRLTWGNLARTLPSSPSQVLPSNSPSDVTKATILKQTQNRLGSPLPDFPPGIKRQAGAEAAGPREPQERRKGPDVPTQAQEQGTRQDRRPLHWPLLSPLSACPPPTSPTSTAVLTAPPLPSLTLGLCFLPGPLPSASSLWPLPAPLLSSVQRAPVAQLL